MIYDFQEQLSIGQEGERAIAQWLSGQWQIRFAELSLQKLGIDLVGVHRDTAEIVTFEVKTDTLAYKTSRAFIETVSNDRSNKPGWAYTCNSDYLIYLLPQSGRVYLIRPDDLRAALPNWLNKYSTGMAKNQGYNTIGVLVPLSALVEIALETTFLGYHKNAPA